MKTGYRIFVLMVLFVFSVNFKLGAEMVAYWNFDEGSGITLTDKSGYNNTGSISGGPAWVSGVKGNALSFDGIDDYVQIPHSSSLNIATQITVSLWINIPDQMFDGFPISKSYDFGPWEMRIYNGLPYFDPTIAVNHYNVIGSPKFTTNTWHHFVGWYDGTRTKVYVDGVDVTTNVWKMGVGTFNADYPVTGSFNVNTEPIRVGRRGSTSGAGFYRGLVDEIRIYNHALTQTEIQNDMNLGLPTGMVSNKIIWSRQYGTTADDVGNGITYDNKGNVYVTGYTGGSLAGNINLGGDDGFLVKYDSTGTRIWTRQFGTNQSEYGLGAACDSLSNVYVTGWTLGGLDGNTNVGNKDIYLVKYDTNGNRIWTRQLGSNNIDIAHNMDIDKLGNIYLVGYTYGELDNNTTVGNVDIFIIKYDTDGNKLWSRQFGTSVNDWATDVNFDSSGNVYVCGAVGTALSGNVSAGGYDIFLAKYDSSGTRLWIKQFGTAGDDGGNEVIIDGANNVYVTGTVSGAFEGNLSLGLVDVFLMKCDTNGNKIWAKQIGSSGNDFADALATDGSGNIYNSGYSEGQFDSNGNLGGRDVIFVKYDMDGNKLWSKQTGTNVNEEILASIGTNTNDIYFTGYTNGNYDTFLNSGGKDIVVTKFSSTQESLFTGKVTKSNTNTGLANVTVQAYQNNILMSSGMTDTNGNYTVYLSTGIYEVRCTKQEFNTEIIYGVEIFSSSSTVVNFSLVPTVPTKPSGFKAQSNTSISIIWTWTDNSGSEDGFRLRDEKDLVIKELPANSISWTETGLNVNTSYYRYVESYNSNGISTATGNVGYTLAAVSVNLTVIAASTSTISLTWSANGNPINTRYAIQRSIDNFNWSYLRTFNDNYLSTGFVDNNVIKATKYYYRVGAYNLLGVATSFTVSVSTRALSDYTVGTVTGKVTRSDGSVAIAKSLVELILNNVIISTTVTNSTGMYYFVDIPTGTYNLRVQITGYQAQQKNDVLVLSEQITTVNFVLEEFVYQDKMVKVWSRQYGTGYDDVGNGITQDNSGNVYVTGYTGGNLSGNINLGGDDVILIKYDSSGTRLWTRQFGTSSADWGYGVTCDNVGNVYVTGWTLGGLEGNTNAGNKDIFVVKYDTNGTRIWTRQLGTNGLDIAYSIETDSLSNVYVVGYTYGGLDNNISLGYEDVFLVKYDSDGNRLWTRQFGTGANDAALDLAIDKSDNIYVCGTTGAGMYGNTSAGSYDVFLAKYDSTGNRLWIKQYGTAGSDGGAEVVVDYTGNVYIACNVTGGFEGNNVIGLDDIALLKCDSNGNKIWAKQIGSTVKDSVEGLTTDSAGNVYYTGFTEGQFDGNVNVGGRDIIFIKYDTQGNKIWCRQMGTTAYDEAWRCLTSGSADVYLVGNTGGSFAGNTVAGGKDLLVIKYSMTVGTITGKITKSDGTTAIFGVTVKVYDSAGVLITTLISDAVGVYALNLATGTYKVTVDAIGYKSQIKDTVIVTDSQPTELNFVLVATNPTSIVHHYEITIPTYNVTAGNSFNLEITAVDSENKKVNVSNSVSIQAVLANDETQAAGGILGITSTVLTNGYAILRTQTYTKSESIKIKVTDNETNIGLSQTITVLPSKNFTVMVTANPLSVVNTQTTQVIANIRDYYNNPVPGMLVNFALTKGVGTLETGTKSSDSNGNVTVTFTPQMSGTGDCTVKVTVNSLTAEVTLKVSILILAKDGGIVVAEDDPKTQLAIPPGVLERDAVINIFRKPEVSLGEGQTFEIVAKEKDTDESIVNLSRPISVTLHYQINSVGKIDNTDLTAGEAREKLGLYYFDGVKWQKINGVVDTSNQTISLQTTHLSSFALRQTAKATRFQFSGIGPNPFTPNPDGIYDRTYFYFENPENKEVSIRVFDLSGFLVKEIDVTLGITPYWDGKNQHNNLVEGGIYIYQLKVGNELQKGTIVLAK